MKKGMIAVGAMIMGVIAGAVAMQIKSEKEKSKLRKRVDKFYGYFHLVNLWLMLKNEGKTLEAFFDKNNYKKIALYGMGELGNRLLEELKGTDIDISYAIDKKADKIYSDLKLVTMEEELESVDAIIVTPIFDYDEIEQLLSEKTDCPIISLEDVVFGIE